MGDTNLLRGFRGHNTDLLGRRIRQVAAELLGKALGRFTRQLAPNPAYVFT